MNKKLKILNTIFIFLNCQSAFSSEMMNQLKTVALQHYPGATIQLGEINLDKKGCVDISKASPHQVTLTEKNKLNVKGVCENEELHLSVQFAANKKILAAKKRIHPTEILDASKVVVREIDLTSPEFYENRGAFLTVSSEINNLETVQSILENHPIYSYQVKKIPDVRKGSPLQVVIQSGKIEIESQGTANEAANVNDIIRVMINKTKKEVVGTLIAPNRVEVQL